MLFPRRKLAEDARRRLGYNIAAGAGGSQVFLSAGAEVAARQAERIARNVLARHHFQAEFAIHRWHPLEERWENCPCGRANHDRYNGLSASAPLPPRWFRGQAVFNSGAVGIAAAFSVGLPTLWVTWAAYRDARRSGILGC